MVRSKNSKAVQLAAVPDQVETVATPAGGPDFHKIANRPTSHLHNLIHDYIEANAGLDIPADTIRQVLALNAEFRRGDEYAAYKAAGGSAAFRAETEKARKVAALEAKLAKLRGETPAGGRVGVAEVAAAEEVPTEEVEDAEDEDESDDDFEDDEEGDDDTEDDVDF